MDIGQMYTLDDLRRVFGCMVCGRITVLSDRPDVVLLAGPPIEDERRANIWDGEVFVFSGEGDKGDMEWTAGNVAVRDHATSRQTLHLFADADAGYRYNGRFTCRSWQECQGPDGRGGTRKILLFNLAPVE